MKTLFIECNMGAAGDMLMGALYELLEAPEKETFLTTMNQLLLGNATVSARVSEKCGIFGTQMEVTVFGTKESASLDRQPSHGTHTSYPQMLAQIDSLMLSPGVKTHAKAIYTLIGEAESKAHHTDIMQIHFHEVGTLDALMDVVGCSILFELLAPEQVIASPVHVGSGTVSCAHGLLPVPAPATAEILRDIPIYGGNIEGELCTPTGAALLKHFVQQFIAMPPMSVEKTGYGMGTKDFPAANCVRIFLGNMNILPVPSQKLLPHVQGHNRPAIAEDMETYPDFYTERFHTLDQILELSCNLDDMTPEAISFATDMLLENGALDVFTTPIHMKKSRPGFLLTCLCKLEQESIFSRLILTHTTTRGIRIHPCYRRTLDTDFTKAATPYGDITIKISHGYGIRKYKPEYDDVASAAKKHKVPFTEVYDTALKAYKNR